MPKTPFVNTFLFFLLLGLPFGAPRAERLLKGSETGLAVRSTNQNYYISTLVGESEHYDPTFYDDHHLVVGEKPVLHFTRVDGEPGDLYFYITDAQDIAFVREFFDRNRADLDRISPSLYSSFQRYVDTQPVYQAKGLYGRVAQAIGDVTSIAPQRVIGEDQPTDEVDAALFQYLRSNGVSSLEELRRRPDLVGSLVNKFYLLSTTYFYRDYPYVRAFLDRLPPLKARAEKEGRPFKAKVFACSTGEEVLTYAVELLEAGIKDFTILATDINAAGLRQAVDMKYAQGVFERLPDATREKLKKYFRLDSSLGVWEPQDPAFFRSRIKYMPQDVLKDLPSDLDPRFAPPYDLISIMNVLFYLDDAAVQRRKDAWPALLVEGGILVLHDYHYSILRGGLGGDWGFRNFLSLNEWVNVKLRPDASAGERVAAYEGLYEREPSEAHFLGLVVAYNLSGQLKKAVRLTESFLEKRPHSGAALSAAWSLYSVQRDTDKMGRTLAAIVRLQPQFVETLSSLTEWEKDRKEKEFLRKLKKSQEFVMANIKNRPRALETLFDFQTPSSEKYAYLKSLLKAHAFAVLQSHYASHRQGAQAERIGREGIRLAESVLRQKPDRLAAAYYLDLLARELLEYYIEAGLDDKALETADRVIAILETVPSADQGYVYVRTGLAHAHLYRALVKLRQELYDQARVSAEAAAGHFQGVVAGLEDVYHSRRSFLYGDAGRAWLTLAEARIKGGDEAGAMQDLDRAFQALEAGLGLNPLYGKNMFEWREQVLRARKSLAGPGSSSEEIPYAGRVVRFRDEYGPYSYSSEKTRYKTVDGASIEATVLTPEAGAPKRPGLVFVHMWARDRNTWWGLPEFLATHGYPSIYMDMRGHGASTFPHSQRRVTIQDPKKEYADFYRDVLPAIERMAAHPSVKNGRLVLVGASLGCPVGMLAAAVHREKFIGMVQLAPSLTYFDVDCRPAMEKLKSLPTYIIAEKTDVSFRGAKEFFNAGDGYRVFMQLDRMGHGTDVLYQDAGIPTVIRRWLEEMEALAPSLRRISQTRPLGKNRKR